MAQVIDVGQWLYDTCGSRTGNLRHVKLAYFGQAWSLAWTGRRLFDAQIEAWPKGPVVPALWRAEKYDQVSPGRIAGADGDRVTEREAAILAAVVDFYSPMSTAKIQSLSHDPVWDQAREGYSPDQHSSEELDTNLILRYYSRLSLTSESVPAAPVGVVCEVHSDEHVLDTSRVQRQRWAVVHERLATA
ncbi:Panacea domain-containing protein [Cellulomonas hominis]